MADLKPIGSEKLPLDQKLKRIMEIANYGIVKPTEDHKTASLAYSIKGADGKTYGIIRENSQYNILKEGSDGYRYLDGMLNNKRYTFSSFSKALKKLNLLMKPINEKYRDGQQLNLIGEQDDTKYVLKTPEVEEEEDFSIDMEDEELDFDAEEELAGEELGAEEELSVDAEIGAEEEENFTKSIQKLTGKLGQKLRDVPETELDGDLVKYVLNSIISAVDLDVLSEEDIEDIINKIEGEEGVDYTEEGEFDVDLSGEEELDIEGEGEEVGAEELDLETELAEEEVSDEELDEFWPAVGRGLAAAARTPAGQAAIGAGIDYGARKISKAFNEEEKIEANFEDEETARDSADAVASIFSEGKTHKTISKYFQYTDKEKRNSKKIQEQKRVTLEEQKSTLLNEALEDANINRNISQSISTYEQETTVKNFLKENKNSKFIGNNTKGSLVFKTGNRVMEITKYGTKL